MVLDGDCSGRVWSLAAEPPPEVTNIGMNDLLCFIFRSVSAGADGLCFSLIALPLSTTLASSQPAASAPRGHSTLQKSPSEAGFRSSST